MVDRIGFTCYPDQLRGATDTDEAMRRRVDHDLYYIDNCSVGFDLHILLLTLISPKASRNAY